MAADRRFSVVQSTDEVLERIFAVLPSRNNTVELEYREQDGLLRTVSFHFDTMAPDGNDLRILGYAMDDSIINIVISDNDKVVTLLLPPPP